MLNLLYKLHYNFLIFMIWRQTSPWSLDLIRRARTSTSISEWMQVRSQLSWLDVQYNFHKERDNVPTRSSSVYGRWRPQRGEQAKRQ